MKQGKIILPESAVDKQTLNFKDSDKLVIIAKGDSRHDGVKIAAEHNCECWGLNDIERFPEMTMLFDLHEKERALKTSPDLPKLKIPVMMQERFLDIPTSVKFPMGGLIDAFGGINYYNNQICQMIAFAIFTRKFKHIYLFGVDYRACDRIEQEFERPCTEFWIGFALSKGISISISPVSTLMSYTGYHKGVIYGYTPNYQLPFEEFRKQWVHVIAEYVLGAHGGAIIGSEVYSHDHWYEELAKFCARYIQDRLGVRMKLEEDRRNGIDTGGSGGVSDGAGSDVVKVGQQKD